MLGSVTVMKECSGTSRWLHKHCFQLMVKVHKGGSPLQLISCPRHLWTKQSTENTCFTNHTRTLHIIGCKPPGGTDGQSGVWGCEEEMLSNGAKCFFLRMKCHKMHWKPGGKVTDLWTRPWFPGCKRKAIGAPSASVARSHGTGWCKGQSRPPAFPAEDPVEMRRACESIRPLWDH